MTLRQQLDETVRAISARTKLRPAIGVIVGSGLGGITKAGGFTIDGEIDYSDLPHLPRSTSPGHAGKLVLGTLGSRQLAVMSGRFHFYEGYTMQQVTYPIRLLRALGVETLILTCIVGGMNPTMPPGSLVLIEDQINLMGANPLIGPNDDALGPRFPDMSDPFDAELRRLARSVAKAEKIALHEGVYVGVAGPNLETRAEYRWLRQIGADIVGMSVVPEVITAVHAGLRVMALAVVSDACDPDHLKPASIEELLRVAAETEPKLTTIVTGVIQRLET